MQVSLEIYKRKTSNYDHHDNVPNENNRERIKNSKYPNTFFNGIPEKNQPKYTDLPKTLFGKSSRSFSSKWHKEFPWLHYNLDKDAAFCSTCMSAEKKGLKTIYHNKNEAFITRSYRNWRHAAEHFRVHEESDCHKDYVNQLSPPEAVCYVDESFDETLIWEKARNRQIFLTLLRNIQFLSRQGLAFRENTNEGNFEQLMKLSAKVDPRIASWMEKKREK